MATRKQKHTDEVAQQTLASETHQLIEAPAASEEPISVTATSAHEAQHDQNSPASAAPLPPEDSTSAPAKPPGRPWSERFIQPIKYSRSNFKSPTGKHLIAFRFDLPAGESRPSEDLLAVLRDHKVFKQGKPCGLTEDDGNDRERISTGLHYQDFGPGLGKLWVMPNGELGRTVADSLDQALHGLAKRIELGGEREV